MTLCDTCSQEFADASTSRVTSLAAIRSVHNQKDSCSQCQETSTKQSEPPGPRISICRGADRITAWLPCCSSIVQCGVEATEYHRSPEFENANRPCSCKVEEASPEGSDKGLSRRFEDTCEANCCPNHETSDTIVCHRVPSVRSNSWQ